MADGLGGLVIPLNRAVASIGGVGWTGPFFPSEKKQDEGSCDAGELREQQDKNSKYYWQVVKLQNEVLLENFVKKCSRNERKRLVFSKDKCHRTALHIARQVGIVSSVINAVEAIITDEELGHLLLVKDSNGRTAFHYWTEPDLFAFAFQTMDEVDVTLRNRVMTQLVMAKDLGGKTILHHGKQAASVSLIIKHLRDTRQTEALKKLILAKDNGSRTALHALTNRAIDRAKKRPNPSNEYDGNDGCDALLKGLDKFALWLIDAKTRREETVEDLCKKARIGPKIFRFLNTIKRMRESGGSISSSSSSSLSLNRPRRTHGWDAVNIGGTGFAGVVPSPNGFGSWGSYYQAGTRGEHVGPEPRTPGSMSVDGGRPAMLSGGNFQPRTPGASSETSYQTNNPSPSAILSVMVPRTPGAGDDSPQSAGGAEEGEGNGGRNGGGGDFRGVETPGIGRPPPPTPSDIMNSLFDNLPPPPPPPPAKSLRRGIPAPPPPPPLKRAKVNPANVDNVTWNI